MRLCSVEGCGRKHDANGLCSAHRRRLNHRFSVDPARCSKCTSPVFTKNLCYMHSKEETKTTCLVEACGKPAYCKNLCKACYHKQYASKRYYKKASKPERKCSISDCEFEKYAKGYCTKHYTLLKQSGKDVTRLACRIPKCKRSHYALNYCHHHYKSNVSANMSTSARFKQVKYVAAKRDLEFDLTLDFYKSLLLSPCFYCKGPLAKSGSAIDRFDNSKGYLMSNSRPCCPSCNIVKGEFISGEEMLKVTQLLKKLRNTDNLWDIKWLSTRK